jgi:hypothetical protein
MRGTILILALPALMLAGCGHREVRETTTVEKQPIVVAPAPSPTVASAPRTCNYASTVFTTGTLSCQGHTQYVCNNGVWDSTGTGC